MLTFQRPVPAGCAYQNNFGYKIVKSITIATAENSSPAACCTMCRQHVECAVFVLSPAKLCTTMSANQGGATAAGFLSGAPQ